MEIKQFDRKAFSVQAVQVTRENMKEVAEWCGGSIETKVTPTRNGQRTEKYVKVDVQKPLNEKQTQAFISDWVLLSGKKFKVYTDKAFHATFKAKLVYTEADAKAQLEGGPTQPVGNIFDNAPAEETEDQKQGETV